MADLSHISRSLSQYGRNGDDHLVHMSGREVAALGKLSPKGHLTRNPATGLPEAFDLEDIIAPIAGLAAGIFAPWALPFIAGASGIGTAIGTGDIGKGIMAGIGSYGMGSLGGMAAGALGIGAGGGAGAGGLASLFGGSGGTTAGAGLMGGDMATSLTAAEAAAPVTTGLGGSVSGFSQLGADFGGGAAASGANTAMAAAAQQAPIMTGIGGTAGLPQITGLPAGASPAAESGGLMNFIKNNPMTVAGGLMAVNSLSPAPTNYQSTAVNQPKGPSQPLVQGPVARPATMPTNYTPGGAEPNFFPGESGNPAMAAPAYVQQAQALNALQSPTQSLAQASMGGGGLGSPQQQALQAMQRRQMGMAEGGEVPDYSEFTNYLHSPFRDGGQPVFPTAPPAQPMQQPSYSPEGQSGSNSGGPLAAGAASVFGPNAYSPEVQQQRLDQYQDMSSGWSNQGRMGLYVGDDGNMWQDDHLYSQGGRVGYAEGGEVEPGADPSSMDPNMVRSLIMEAKAAILGQSDHPEEAIERFKSVFGPEALQQLAAAVQGQGGAVQGPGDGVSDSVPGSIDGVAPVQLASDEHVIPADAVAHLGNGSSAHGHRVLKEMTARVRAAKTGQAGMPKPVNAQDYMPS